MRTWLNASYKMVVPYKEKVWSSDRSGSASQYNPQNGFRYQRISLVHQLR
jgi:hypothetical protein